jgi:hypothetical protein
MNTTLGLGPAIVLGLAAYATTVGVAAARDAGGLMAPPVSRVVQTQSEEAAPVRENEERVTPAFPDALLHRSDDDGSLRHERAHHRVATPLRNDTQDARVTKDAARREAAQFGVIALISTIRADLAAAPSAWSQAAGAVGSPAGDIVRGPVFDRAIDSSRLALSSLR